MCAGADFVGVERLAKQAYGLFGVLGINRQAADRRQDGFAGQDLNIDRAGMGHAGLGFRFGEGAGLQGHCPRRVSRSRTWAGQARLGRLQTKAQRQNAATRQHHQRTGRNAECRPAWIELLHHVPRVPPFSKTRTPATWPIEPVSRGPWPFREP